jgi:hypothetical protein
VTLSLKTVITRADLTKRNHGQIMKEILQKSVSYHAAFVLPRHFQDVPETHPGSGGYKYRSRTSAYTKQKQRKYGHKRPNVYSGELRQSVLSKVRITATQHIGRLTTRGTMRSRMADWQKREITIISTREAVQYRKEWAKTYKRLAKSTKYRRKRRRRIGR